MTGTPMTVLLRLLLILLPIVAMLLFLRYRMRRERTGEEQDAEIRRIQRIMIGLAGAFLLIALSLYIVTDTGTPGSCYVSPRTVEGRVVPGHFVAEDDPACLAERARKTPSLESLKERLNQKQEQDKEKPVSADDRRDGDGP